MGVTRDRIRLALAGVAGAAALMGLVWLVTLAAVAAGVHAGEGQP